MAIVFAQGKTLGRYPKPRKPFEKGLIQNFIQIKGLFGSFSPKEKERSLSFAQGKTLGRRPKPRKLFEKGLIQNLIQIKGLFGSLSPKEKERSLSLENWRKERAKGRGMNPDGVTRVSHGCAERVDPAPRRFKNETLLKFAEYNL